MLLTLKVILAWAIPSAIVFWLPLYSFSFVEFGSIAASVLATCILPIYLIEITQAVNAWGEIARWPHRVRIADTREGVVLKYDRAFIVSGAQKALLLARAYLRKSLVFHDVHCLLTATESKFKVGPYLIIALLVGFVAQSVGYSDLDSAAIGFAGACISWISRHAREAWTRVYLDDEYSLRPQALQVARTREPLAIIVPI